MMKKRKFIYCIDWILIFSCKKWQRNESHNDFTVEKLIVDTKQTECLDTNQYIIPKILSLKGSEGMILPQYDKIVFQNGKIYVMDKEITKNVVVFDSLGNYLYKVGEVGRALNELYRQPTNFEVNSQSGNIYLFDSEGRKIIKYDVFGKYYSTDILEDFWPYAFGLTAATFSLFATLFSLDMFLYHFYGIRIRFKLQVWSFVNVTDDFTHWYM